MHAHFLLAALLALLLSHHCAVAQSRSSQSQAQESPSYIGLDAEGHNLLLLPPSQDGRVLFDGVDCSGELQALRAQLAALKLEKEQVRAQHKEDVRLLQRVLCDSAGIADRLSVAQVLDTDSATDSASFSIDGQHYLAVSNFRDVDSGAFNIKSTVYRWDPAANEYKTFQSVDTLGCFSVEHMVMGGEHYLGFFNFIDGIKVTLDSPIYKWHAGNGRFELFQLLRTSGAADANHLVIDQQDYLAVASFSPLVTESVIFARNATGHFVEYQRLNTKGAIDFEPFTITTLDASGQPQQSVFLALAQRKDDVTSKIDSPIYKWQPDTKRFEVFQTFESSGGRSWTHMEISGDMYLVLTNNYNDTTYRLASFVFRWDSDTKRFTKVQELPSYGATEAQFLDVAGTPYLVIANDGDDADSNTDVPSSLYAWSTRNKAFELVQNFNTNGAWDVEHITLGEDHYLFVGTRQLTRTVPSFLFAVNRACV